MQQIQNTNVQAYVFVLFANQPWHRPQESVTNKLIHDPIGSPIYGSIKPISLRYLHPFSLVSTM